MKRSVLLLAALLIASLTTLEAQSVPQAFTVIQQTITGSGSITTSAVNINGTFTRARYSWSISQPQNSSTSASCVVQGSTDGTTWFDMFGMGTVNGTSASAEGAIGNLPKLARAQCTWNGGFVVSISVTMFP